MTGWQLSDFPKCPDCKNRYHIDHGECPHCADRKLRIAEAENHITIAPKPPEIMKPDSEGASVPVRLKKRGKNKWQYLGLRFDSKDEAYRYGYLKDMQDEGIIRHLSIQPTMVIRPAFELSQPHHVKRKGGKPRTIPAETYTPDYAYICNGMLIIEDVKGLSKGKPYSKANSDRSQKHLQYRYRNNPHVMFMLVTMDKYSWRYWQASTGYPEIEFTLEATAERRIA